MRLLGIDYGDKKVGLALGESDALVATPLEVVPTQKIFERISELVAQEDIKQCVVGVPLSTGDHHNAEQLEKTRAFIRELGLRTRLEIFEEDESFTTAESIRLQKEEGVSAAEDALCAMLIVRAYMERNS